jgi:hypothetical protein
VGFQVVDSVSVFFSYSHKDEELRNALDVHMAPLRRGKLISSWHDRKIGAGTEWDAAISAQLQAADIIVLLLSPDFLASDYCNDTEIPAALARHTAGEAVVIPVVLRPFNWFNSPVAHLQSLPRDKKAVTTWPDRDQAFVTVADGIREEATRVLELRRQQALQRDGARERYRTKVLEALSDGRISLPERETLDELRDELQLSPEEAKTIEAKAAEPIKKYGEDLERYKRTLLKVIEEEYPIGEQMREDLKLRRRDLGLKDEDADRVEAPILAAAEASHQTRLAAPPAAQAPPPAVSAPPPAVSAPPPAAPPPPPAVAAVAAPSPQPPAAAAAQGVSAPAVLAEPLAAGPRSAPAVAPRPPRLPREDVGDLVQAALAACGLSGDLHLAPKIPASKLNNARKSCKLPEDEQVLGLLDLTIFGSASDAMLFGRRGIYFHNDAGDPKDHQLRWADWAQAVGAGFRATDAQHVLAPDGASLDVSCGLASKDVAALLADIHQRVLADADAGAADEDGAAEADAALTAVTGPVIRAPEGAQAQDKAAWSHLFADLRADLNDAVSRLLYDPEAGSDLRVFALADDARADLFMVFTSEAGELLVAVWGNQSLPPVLGLAHATRKHLTDGLGFGVLTGHGLAFARSFGPVDDVDVDDVVAVANALIVEVFDLPRGGLAVSWELLDL